MKAQETLDTPYGEMLDMISCMAIYNGMEEKDAPPSWEDVMRMK